MSEVTHVDYTEMRASAEKLNRGRDEIVQNLEQMQTMVKNLIDTSFKMQKSSPKFQDSYTQWTTGAKSAIDGLNDMSAFLMNTVKSLQDVDQQVANGAVQ